MNGAGDVTGVLFALTSGYRIGSPEGPSGQCISVNFWYGLGCT